jgi:hypothetical protein
MKITLDSMLISVPVNMVKVLFDGYVERREYLNEIVVDCEYKTFELLGLKYVKVDRLKRRVEIEISAKILKENYLKKISVDTIEQVFREIEKYGVLKFLDVNEAIENACLFRGDFAKDLKLSENPNLYVFELKRAVNKMSKRKWNIEEGKGNTSVVFKEKKKTNRLRTIFYNKEVEMLRGEEFKRLGIEIEAFKNVLRYEINARSFENIRKLTGIQKKGEVKLLDVLNSESNPWLTVFRSLVPYEQQTKEIDKKFFRSWVELDGAMHKFGGLEEYRNRMIEEGFDRGYVARVINRLKIAMSYEKTSNRIKEIYELLKSG